MEFKVAVGYARTSGEINPKTSIPNQIHVIEEYCKEHKIFLKKIYVDECKTGTQVQGRDQYIQMIDTLEAEKVDLVIVSNFDRLSRKSFEFTGTVKKLKQNYIDVYSIAHGLNTLSMQDIQISIAGAQAEWENNMRIERLSSGRKHVRSQGKFNANNVPFGYKLDEERYLIIHPEEAIIVKELFDVFLSKKNYAHTIKEIKEKHPTFTLKQPSVRKILARALYIGRDCVIRENDESDVYFEMISNRSHAPIISEETFLNTLECIESIKRKTGTSKKPHAKYLLTNSVICMECGQPIKGDRGSYTCPCEMKISVEELHAVWIEFMKTIKEHHRPSINQIERDRVLQEIEDNRIRFATCKISIKTYERKEGELYEKIRLLTEQADVDAEVYRIRQMMNLFKAEKVAALRKLIRENNLQLQIDMQNKKLYQHKQNLA